ncbi:unnamed protein product [Adineta steineri]|uniref:NHL repeat containing protein-like protein n=1 Tax=Adineta steineri TaxID=433720 RepID=A0A814KGE6_9BILA|nr:unnamed protein product [Adineta steineri]CAF1042327.1 unnamed protein product [Adineta steineri]CAF1051276.1 unnamed protein product [Adineta steineri]
MDQNQVYSGCVTGNIEARKWWHRRWVKIIGISLALLTIFAGTLTLLLKFVILAPKQLETSTALPRTRTLSTPPSPITAVSTLLSSASRQTIKSTTTTVQQPHDDSKRIYIADWGNHRIVEWEYGANNGEVVTGSIANGNQINQFNLPTGVTLDKNNHSLIVCDYNNRRVVRWFYRTTTSPQIIISNIDCFDVKLDKNGDLYVSDVNKCDVKRWTAKDSNETIVAGGRCGNNLKQLMYLNFIFIDQEYSVYVADRDNNRVMKWVRGAQEGIVVAGGHGQGSSVNQLSHPHGVIVDQFDNVYVADHKNHRIMRW